MNIEKRLFDFYMRIIAFAVILTSCNPYVQTPATTVSPTVRPTATQRPPQLVKEHPTPTPPPVCTVTGTVYLRPDPSRAHAPLAILRTGHVVTVIERGAYWHSVTTGTSGQAPTEAGFIASRYCEIGE
jgi:hypothetical protein